jgi:hypothetical protein
MAVRPFEFPQYKVPQLVAESGDDQMSTENLSTLLGKVSDTSTGKIDNLIATLKGCGEN